MAMSACAPKVQHGAGTLPKAGWCIPGPGRVADSAYIVGQAASALIASTDTGAAQFLPDTLIHVYSHGVSEGTLIRMLVAPPSSARGGGGLEWVDAETACALVLVHYE
jgi:hypothetical protein